MADTIVTGTAGTNSKEEEAVVEPSELVLTAAPRTRVATATWR